jgi:hypothetical protein
MSERHDAMPRPAFHACLPVAMPCQISTPMLMLMLMPTPAFLMNIRLNRNERCQTAMRVSIDAGGIKGEAEEKKKGKNKTAGGSWFLLRGA